MDQPTVEEAKHGELTEIVPMTARGNRKKHNNKLVPNQTEVNNLTTGLGGVVEQPSKPVEARYSEFMMVDNSEGVFSGTVYLSLQSQTRHSLQIEIVANKNEVFRKLSK